MAHKFELQRWGNKGDVVAFQQGRPWMLSGDDITKALGGRTVESLSLYSGSESATGIDLATLEKRQTDWERNEAAKKAGDVAAAAPVPAPPSDSFRPRKSGETMQAYLEAQQAAVGGVDFGKPTDITAAGAGQKYYKDGKEFNPALYTNLKPGTPGFENYLKEQGITTQAPTTEITSDIFEDKGEDAIGKSAEQNVLLENIQQSFDINPNLSANAPFIHGVAKLAGREATAEELAMAGQSISKIAEHFGITGMLKNYGMAETVEEAGKSKEQTITDLTAKVESGVALSPEDKDNWKHATGNENYPTAPTPSFEDATGTQAPPEFKTAGNAVSDLYDTLISQKQTEMLEGVKMTDIMTKKNEANIAVETARQAIVDKNLIDAVELENIAKNEAIPMILIGRQQAKYSSDEYITNLKMAQDYNNKLILAKMAEGNFLEAQRINKDIANDNYEIQKLQLDQLMYNDKIKQDEYDRMEKEVNYERELALNGYSYISNTEAYNEIVKRYNITPANFDNFIYKDPTNNKRYLKNLEEDKKYQFIKATVDQPAGTFDPATGKFTPTTVADGKVDPITGALTDPTKVIQGYDFTSYATDKSWGNSVSSILEKMGQFKTTEDIDNYIQSIAPGSEVTGDIVRQVSEEYQTSWELLSAIMQQESHFGTEGLAVGANNPGNVGTTDELAARGEANKFPTMLDGVRAIGRNIDRRRVATIGDTGFPTDEDIENLSMEERNVMQAIMRLLPTKLKDALQEKAERQKEVIFSYRQGKSFQTIADEFQGFIIAPEVNEADKGLASTLRAMATGTDLDLRNISAPINLGQPVKAMTNVENANLAEAQGELAELSSSRALIKGADRVLSLLENAPTEHLGKFDGTTFKIEKWFGLSDEDAQKAQQLETAMVNLLNEIRRKSLGTAVTESEVKFLEPLLTSLLDQPGIIKTKMNELKRGTMIVHNEARGTVNLPQISQEQLLNNNLRLKLYYDTQTEMQGADGMSDEEAYDEYLKTK